jgi:hypothetical protein
LICIDPLSAILLLVSLFSAKGTGHLVAVGVVSRIVTPQLLLILIAPVVILLAVILAILLASILLVLLRELLCMVFGYSIHSVLFLLLLDSLDLWNGFGLIF